MTYFKGKLLKYCKGQKVIYIRTGEKVIITRVYEGNEWINPYSITRYGLCCEEALRHLGSNPLEIYLMSL